jgi:hypothetical protein
MKRWSTLLTAVAFLAAGAAVGQTASESKTKEKSGHSSTMTTKTKTASGTVKEYEAGKKIKITGPADKTYSFDLDENARVEGNIAVGQMAKVEYTKDNAGKDHVTVLSEAKGAMSSTPSKAEAAESNAAHGGSMHMESTSKHKGPGPDTKTKTETVIGTVKTYEAGKKITVTGPKDKDYTFDLDENVAMKGTTNVGDRVKVTYSKMDGGDKVTTIVPAPTASHSKKTKKSAA